MIEKIIASFYNKYQALQAIKSDYPYNDIIPIKNDEYFELSVSEFLFYLSINNDSKFESIRFSIHKEKFYIFEIEENWYFDKEDYDKETHEDRINELRNLFHKHIHEIMEKYRGKLSIENLNLL